MICSGVYFLLNKVRTDGSPDSRLWFCFSKGHKHKRKPFLNLHILWVSCFSFSILAICFCRNDYQIQSISFSCPFHPSWVLLPLPGWQWSVRRKREEMHREASLKGIVFEDEEDESDEEEGVGLPRVTSLDALHSQSPSPPSPSSPSSLFSYPLGSSLDNLTIPNDEESLEKKEKRISNGSTVPEDCDWWIKYLGFEEEKKCFLQGALVMFRLHFYSLLCLIVCGTYLFYSFPILLYF